MKECCRPGRGRIHNLLIMVRTHIQLSHWGRHWSKVLSISVLKSYLWLLNLHISSYFHFQHCLHRWVMIADVIPYAFVWFINFSYVAHYNKDNESNNDNWLKYPIILSDPVLQSLSSFLIFWRPCFCNLGKLQMWNGDLQFFVVST